jgi:hypothetical protein
MTVPDELKERRWWFPTVAVPMYRCSPIVTGKTLQHQKGLMGCADLLLSSILLTLRPLYGLFRNLGTVGVIEWLASLTAGMACADDLRSVPTLRS